MEFLDLVKRTRSYRRFDQTHAISEDTVRHLIECARLTSSGGNNQPLKYYATRTPPANAAVFDALAWAGSLPDWPGPSEGERPTAYIVICTDTSIAAAADTDLGIAAETILLAATHAGLGGCMFGSVQRPKVREALSIPEQLKVSLVVAIGKPVEDVRLVELAPDQSTKYYRDADGVHYVPKRRLEDVLMGIT